MAGVLQVISSCLCSRRRRRDRQRLLNSDSVGVSFSLDNPSDFEDDVDEQFLVVAPMLTKPKKAYSVVMVSSKTAVSPALESNYNAESVIDDQLTRGNMLLESNKTVAKQGDMLAEQIVALDNSGEEVNSVHLLANRHKYMLAAAESRVMEGSAGLPTRVGSTASQQVHRLYFPETPAEIPEVVAGEEEEVVTSQTGVRLLEVPLQTA